MNIYSELGRIISMWLNHWFIVFMLVSGAFQGISPSKKPNNKSMRVFVSRILLVINYMF